MSLLEGSRSLLEWRGPLGLPQACRHCLEKITVHGSAKLGNQRGIPGLEAGRLAESGSPSALGHTEPLMTIEQQRHRGQVRDKLLHHCGVTFLGAGGPEHHLFCLSDFFFSTRGSAR